MNSGTADRGLCGRPPGHLPRLETTMTDQQIPEPTVQPTRYLVTCLPEGHDDRWTFTIQVQHTGRGLFAVRHGIRHYGSDGTWSYEPDFDEDDAAEAEWAKEHRFDHDTALRLAKELAPTLTYRGLSVVDVLAGGVVR